jgi:arylsulfatase
LNSVAAVVQVAFDRIGRSFVPQCSTTDVAKQQRLGSEILWLICAKCAHVWCSIAPRLPYRTNGIQSHEDLYVTLVAAAGLPDLTETLLKGYKMGGTTYKVHLDGYNNLDHWTGKSETSARRVHFYYDETDLMAIRLDNWKMHIGIKPEGSWWDEKSYPSVPYVFNLRMDPMEKMDPQSHEWGYIGRKFLGAKSWVTTGAGPFIAAHIKSLTDFPPSQGTDTLSLKKALEKAQDLMERPNRAGN